MSKLRFGLGFDVHVFTKKKKVLTLGGIDINCGFGLRAVSDGDAVLHAASDAILGAACLGDIGDYFPCHNKKNRGLASGDIAGYVLNKIKNKYALVNIDITIISQKPPLAKYKRRMTRSLKNIFGTDNINIKIKSKEGLNILGGKNALSCMCAALLIKR
ncbi:MAG: 2-C-methyl-D-erythritol 2,4-cyclodiphosphate synthase [Candidatus Omnitrophota bacterium]